MRILHIIWSLEIGGAECLLVDIANRLTQVAHVSLIVINKIVDHRLRDSLCENVNYIELKRQPGSMDPRYLLRLHRTVVQLKPDLIHCHTSNLRTILPFVRCPFVLTVHDTNLTFGSEIQRYKKVFCISEAVRQELDQRRPGLPLRVIHNGIDFDRFRPRPNIAVHDFRLVQIARLEHDKKGQDIILMALASILAHCPNIPITLHIVGTGPSRSYLENLSARLNLENNIDFIGKVPREWVYDNLANYDLLILPSRYEGFGLVVVEAIASRVPVLVSELEGPMEIVEDGRLGWSFLPENVEDCAQKILEIRNCLLQPDYWTSEAEARRDYAKTKYDIETTVSRYLNEYRTTVGDKKR